MSRGFFLALFLSFAWLLSTFWHPVFGPTGFNDQRFVVSFLGLVAAIIVVFNRNDIASICPDLGQRRNLAVLLVTSLTLSLLLANHPERAIQEAGGIAGALLMMFVVYHFFAQLELDQACQIFYVVLVILLAIYTVNFIGSYAYVLLKHGSPSLWVVFPNFPNQRLFNHLQSIFIPALCAASYYFLARRWFFLCVIAVIVSLVWIAAIPYSLGRGVGLSLIFGGCVSAYFTFKGSKFFYLWVLGLVLLGGVLYWYACIDLPLRLGAEPYSYLARVLENHSGGRIEIWLFAVKGFISNPLFGIGAGHFVVAHGDVGSPHNILMLVLFEWGLLPTLGFVWLLSVGVSCFKTANLRGVPRGFHVSAGIWTAASALIYSMFSGNWLTPAAQIGFALVGGGLFRISKAETVSGFSVKAAPRVKATDLMAALAVASSFVTFCDVAFNSDLISQASEGSWVPRYWLNGNFLVY
ncbi:O-antigen ligase family protein [Zhongshania sp.]|uniref:O-antigen ligase family protein n=1 Tax=Zhongshania sp. TaxID=1971902 RepID=UPI003563A0B1